MLGALVEARPPVDDAVAPRVDREVADPPRHTRGQVRTVRLAALAVSARGPEEAADAEGAEHAHRDGGSEDEGMDGERVELRRAERDDSGHEVGPPHRQHLREVAAAALPDERDLLAVGLNHHLEPLLEPLDRDLRAVHVRSHPGLAGAVARSPKPAGHHRERVVAREEPRDQHHRLAARVGYALAADDGVAEERGELETEPSLPPERGKREK